MRRVGRLKIENRLWKLLNWSTAVHDIQSFQLGVNWHRSRLRILVSLTAIRVVWGLWNLFSYCSWSIVYANGQPCRAKDGPIKSSRIKNRPIATSLKIAIDKWWRTLYSILHDRSCVCSLASVGLIAQPFTNRVEYWRLTLCETFCSFDVFTKHFLIHGNEANKRTLGQ